MRITPDMLKNDEEDLGKNIPASSSIPDEIKKYLNDRSTMNNQPSLDLLPIDEPKVSDQELVNLDSKLNEISANKQRAPQSIPVSSKKDLDSLQNLVEPKVDNVIKEEPKNEIDELNDKYKWLNLISGISKAGNIFSHGVAGKQLDPTLFDNTAEYKQQLENIKLKPELELNKIKTAKEKELDDPNSEVSAQYKGYAKKIGLNVPEGATARSLERIIGLRERMAERELSAEDRKIRREELKMNRDMLSEQKRQSNAQSFEERMSNAIAKDQSYKDYMNGVGSLKRLDSALKDPNAIRDTAAIYSLFKELDPGSVVRESEYKTGEKAAGLVARLKTLSSQVGTSPRNLTPKTIEQIQSLVKEINDNNKNTLKRRLNPVLNQAKTRGANVENIIDKSILDEINNESSPVKESKTEEMVQVRTKEGKIISVPKSRVEELMKK